MKFLAFTFFIFLSFSVSANCAAPVELVLSVDENEPGTVILKYGYDTKLNAEYDDGSNYIYRSGTLVTDSTVYQFPFDVGAYSDDDYIIATEKCVPPGEWTYVIPFFCYSASCNCANYATIVVEDYESECKNSTKESNISKEKFQEKQRSESWYGDGPSNPDNSSGCGILFVD